MGVDALRLYARLLLASVRSQMQYRANLALALVAVALGASVSVFAGLIVLRARATFWTIETLEVFNAFTYGGVTAAEYPMTIYASWFRKFFAFVVPRALVTYFPMIGVLDRED